MFNCYSIFHHWHVQLYVSPSLLKSMSALLISAVNSNQLIGSKAAEHVQKFEHFRSYVEVWLLFCGLHQSIMNCWIWSSKESLWLEKINVTDSEHCKLANTTNNMASAIYMYTAIQFIHDFRVFFPPKKKSASNTYSIIDYTGTSVITKSVSREHHCINNCWLQPCFAWSLCVHWLLVHGVVHPFISSGNGHTFSQFYYRSRCKFFPHEII